MDPTTTISIIAEIPEHLHQGIELYLTNNPAWDYDRFMAGAIALFLLQNGASADPDNSQLHRKAARTYLDNLFGGVSNG